MLLACAFIVAIFGGCAPAGPTPAPTPAPEIYSVSSPGVVHAGQTVSGVVRTSPDVVAVTARVGIFKRSLVRESPGIFTLVVALPSSVPWFVRRRWTITIEARNAHGETTSRREPVVFS